MLLSFINKADKKKEKDLELKALERVSNQHSNHQSHCNIAEKNQPSHATEYKCKQPYLHDEGQFPELWVQTKVFFFFF